MRALICRDGNCADIRLIRRLNRASFFYHFIYFQIKWTVIWENIFHLRTSVPHWIMIDRRPSNFQQSTLFNCNEKEIIAIKGRIPLSICRRGDKVADFRLQITVFHQLLSLTLETSHDESRFQSDKAYALQSAENSVKQQNQKVRWAAMRCSVNGQLNGVILIIVPLQ